MSWRPEVQTDSTGKWYPNGLRFATEEEAFNNARDLAGRWWAVTEYRAALSDEPVKHSYVDGQLKRLD